MREMELRPLEGYDWGAKIGGGSFSSVYKAYTKGSERNIVAVKVISRYKKTVTQIAISEIILMKSLTHEHIVKFIDCQHDSQFVYIIMEYCNEGDLLQMIKIKYRLTEPIVQMIFQQLASALKYLVQQKICHMDLKPQNILLTKNPNLTVKLADFGLSKILSDENLEQNRFAGSLPYMAPEKLLHHKYDSKIDLWSIGIIMYECLTGRTPFGNGSTNVIIEFIRHRNPIKVPQLITISDECADLMDKLLKYNPEERISFDTFFSHPFLSTNFLPTPENYELIRSLIKEATTLETDGKYTEALKRCIKAIKYLEAFLMTETAPNLVAYINRKLAEYRIFENKLHDKIEEQNKYLGSLSSYCTLKRSYYCTPTAVTGIDIAQTAEMYYAEGKNELAFEKWKNALDILIPVLHSEPSGFRRDLLYAHVNRWLNIAEMIKPETGQ